jgi:D-alanine-D-alanine ligase
MDGLPPVSLSPLRIAVLAGGDSAEREVSLKSGACVVEALRQRGHAVTAIDPAETPLEDVDWSRFDVAFLALHGTFGEDGGVQSLLEKHGVAFTGSGSEASRLAFSKSAAKERFRIAQVPTPEYILIHETDPRERIMEQSAHIGFPQVVKPNAQGSSIGVTMVRTPEQLEAALKLCFEFDSFGIIEREIIGSEWTLGVIDNEPLPLIHIATHRGFFDYHAKYEDDATQYLFEPDLDPALEQKLTETGLRACRALGTSGVARVDIMLDEAGQPWVLEVNTIPGMTDHSLVPKAAARIGLDMGQLCEVIIHRLLQERDRARMRHAS